MKRCAETPRERITRRLGEGPPLPPRYRWATDADVAESGIRPRGAAFLVIAGLAFLIGMAGAFLATVLGMNAPLPLTDYDGRRVFDVQADALKAATKAERATGGASTARTVRQGRGGYYVVIRHPRTHELQGFLGYDLGDADGC